MPAAPPAPSNAMIPPSGAGSGKPGRALKALKEDRILVFIDESGLSQKPHRVRTWAPCGKTPVLALDFNWKQLSVIGGITVGNFYFQFGAMHHFPLTAISSRVGHGRPSRNGD